MIKVLVSGAAGRMGREVVKAVTQDPETTLVGAVDKNCVGRDAGELAGLGALCVPVSADLKTTLHPSGTAFKTAQVMRAARDRDFQRIGGDEEADGSSAPHSRGGQIGGAAIHSVRLPGYLAHQEVIFGMAGQTLSIRHDTITRECYMPGVLRAIKAVQIGRASW